LLASTRRSILFLSLSEINEAPVTLKEGLTAQAVTGITMQRGENKGLAYAKMLFAEGNRHMSAGNTRQAEACFREVIRLVPDSAEAAHTNLGLLLDQEGKSAEAEHHYLQSIALNPNRGKAHMDLGVLLAKQGRFEEADKAYRRALELTPNSAEAWSNMGVLQTYRKQEKEAEESYRKAMAIDPRYRLACVNLSYLLLRQGRFEEGWLRLDARDWYGQLEQRLPYPRWRGESLKGRSLLIGFEAGHGDMIQFCRYAAVLKTQGAGQIGLICHPALKSLFSTASGVDSVFAFDEDFVLPPSEWDFWTPPLSIPLYCRTRIDSIPANIPYLRADEKRLEKWSSVLSKGCTPSDIRVGLVWKGSARFENDADRSLPCLETLEPLGSGAGMRFFSLQKLAGEDEAARPPAGLPVVNLGPQISDFADSAAIVANLDLIICVDTAIAHLAGAMGKDCWVLLPDYMTDWRWLTNRNDSPWYPRGMRLFRQPRRGDWAAVVSQVRMALQSFLAVPRPHG
jgi:Flp pilus assembly protein TadD